jgi:FkbM family methyltransferase
MPPPSRKVAFVTVATHHGTFILNRFDYQFYAPHWTYFGVGFELLDKAVYVPSEIKLSLRILDIRRKHFGDGVVAVDCGANIGVLTVEWAKHMAEWGSVLAIEAQEWVYYALAGNLAINNCFNTRALNAAVGAEPGMMKIPTLNQLAPASFGSLELKKRNVTEVIGQKIDYSNASMVDVQTVSIDSLDLARIDFVKIDVEGMELEVLEGAAASIAKHRPILMIEWTKNDKNKLKSRLENSNYTVLEYGMNFVAVHESDKSLVDLKV